MPTLFQEMLTNFEKTLTSVIQNGFYHPRFGDLASPKAVVLEASGPGLEIDRGTIFHVTVTGRCNACCEGCINVSLTCGGRHEALSLFEADPTREAQAVITLAQGAERPITVAFYGGEPFLAPEKMDLMRRILRAELGEEVRFMVYTNGMLLDQALTKYPDLVRDLWLVSLSIDGQKEQHEAVRRGTNLDQIHHNLKLLRTTFPQVRVLVWSTLREEQSLTDCFVEFLNLYDQGLADYFFYHFAETEKPFTHFEDYLLRYEKEFSFLLEVFIRRLSEGELLPIVHLNELLAFILSGHRRGHTACGAELATNFDLVGGKVLACADLPQELALGEIAPGGEVSLKLHDLSFLAAYRHPLGCEDCGIEPYCGGRCPVQALTGSPLRTRQYCQLLRLHVGLVQEALPELQEVFNAYGLSAQDLYQKVGFLARYTDVVP